MTTHFEIYSANVRLVSTIELFGKLLEFDGMPGGGMCPTFDVKVAIERNTAKFADSGFLFSERKDFAPTTDGHLILQDELTIHVKLSVAPGEFENITKMTQSLTADTLIEMDLHHAEELDEDWYRIYNNHLGTSTIIKKQSRKTPICYQDVRFRERLKEDLWSD